MKRVKSVHTGKKCKACNKGESKKIPTDRKKLLAETDKGSLQYLCPC